MLTPHREASKLSQRFTFRVAWFHKGGGRVSASEWLLGRENVNIRAVNEVPQINPDYSLHIHLQEAYLLQHTLKVLSKHGCDSVPRHDSHLQGLNLWEQPANFKHIPWWSHCPRVRKPMQENGRHACWRISALNLLQSAFQGKGWSF